MRIRPLAWVGSIAASAAIGFSIAQVGRSFVDAGKGATVGDWLSFVGSLLGSFVAVAGAVWVEEYKRRSEANRGMDLLSAALDQLDGPMKIVDESAHNPDRAEVLQHDLRVAFHVFREAGRAIAFAREQTRLPSMKLFNLLGSLERHLAEFGSLESKLSSAWGRDPAHVREIGEHAEFISGTLQHVIRQIREELRAHV